MYSKYMSASNYNARHTMPGFSFGLKPSRWLTALWLAKALGALLLIVCLPLVWYWRLLSVFSVLVCMVYAIRRYAMLLAPASIVGVSVNSQQRCCLLRRDGASVYVVIQDQTVIYHWLTLVLYQTLTDAETTSLRTDASLARWCLPWRGDTFLVLADSTDAESFRAWRVWLRWASQAPAQTGLENSETNLL